MLEYIINSKDIDVITKVNLLSMYIHSSIKLTDLVSPQQLDSTCCKIFTFENKYNKE